MEKERFWLFLFVTMLIMTVFMLLEGVMRPPADEQPERELADHPAPPAEPDAPLDLLPPRELDPDEVPPTASQWITLGSLDPREAPFLVTLNNRGAAIERIELSGANYRDLDAEHGYLGNLAPTDEPAGVRLNVVGPGTPAALATSDQTGVANGLQAGDLLLEIDGQAVAGVEAFERRVHESTRPGEELALTVERGEDGAAQRLTFRAQLTRRPLELLRPEPRPLVEGKEWHFTPREQWSPLSALLSLVQVGSAVAQRDGELPMLPSLRDSHWQVDIEDAADGGRTVQFSFRLEGPAMAELNAGPLEVRKVFRFEPAVVDGRPSYALGLEIQIDNEGEQATDVVYRLDGPNGLPLEGWWYTHKIHPSRWFAGAGARDVVWGNVRYGHQLLGTAETVDRVLDARHDGTVLSGVPSLGQGAPLFVASEDLVNRTLRYIGVETQYFAVAYLPEPDETLIFQRAVPVVAEEIDPAERRRLLRTANTSFFVVSERQRVEPGQTHSSTMRVFAGPKDPPVLADHRLSNLSEYGLFGWIARPLSHILHFFYSIVGNYALAIILLTVLVRGLMFPISRKAAMNAQMMQELAPEMKKIAEKYKGDMEKRAKAQQDLFRRHNYNPFGGCLLMFLQLPIFIGLYRCLSVDVRLRQAPMIPGLDWASNLSAPDMLWYWQPYLPEFLAGPTGWLGPYFNILPLATVVLFLVHMKLFTPPATDEQTLMTQRMMKYMTLFIGLLFFKVASGLCLYFIASSLWGIAERKLLPKTLAKKSAEAAKPAAPARAKPAGNGARPSDAVRARRKQRRK